MKQSKLSVRINRKNENHHIWNNNGKWWCHLTLHKPDYTAERHRVHCILGHCEVRQRRDKLLQSGQGKSFEGGRSMSRYKRLLPTSLSHIGKTQLCFCSATDVSVQRRKMIIEYYENEVIDQLICFWIKLSDDSEKRLIHPSFMGGEYLPDCGEDETEIARIELRSTLADVISIRN